MALRILLLEPEVHAREGLKAILAAAGHEVSVAEDLASGFKQLCSAGPFDLLLIDADITPRQGVLISVTDFLRLARIGQEGTRGILLASCPDEIARDWALQGIAAVLEKPVELSRLRLELEAAEARPRPQSDAGATSQSGRRV